MWALLGSQGILAVLVAILTCVPQGGEAHVGSCKAEDVIDASGNLLQASVECGEQERDPRARVQRPPLVAEQEDHMGRSRLHVAVSSKVITGEAIMSLRGDCMARDKAGQTPLHLAAQRGHVEAVSALLDLRADLEAVDDRRRTALHLAAYRGHAAMVEALVVRRASVNSADHGGHTPLLLASRFGRFSAALHLIHGDADVGMADSDGRTALHEAVTADHPVTAQLLLEAGAAPEAKDRWGRTALHDAARSGSHKAAQLLLTYGASADVQAPGFNGPETPKTVADQFKRHKVTAVFNSPPKYNRCPEKELLGAAESTGLAGLLNSLFRRSPSGTACANAHRLAADSGAAASSESPASADSSVHEASTTQALPQIGASVISIVRLSFGALEVPAGSQGRVVSHKPYLGVTWDFAAQLRQDFAVHPHQIMEVSN